MLRVENVATPLAAATVVVPARAPPPGFVPIAAVTLPLNPVAVLPCASWTVTCTAGVIVAPAVVLVGCTVNTSWLAGPGVMVNGADVAPTRLALLAASVYPVPALSHDRLLNPATPPTAAMVVEPERAPPLRFVPSATVTFPVN